MTIKEKFIEFVEEVTADVEVPGDIARYWETFKSKSEKEKSLLTPNGEEIIAFLKENPGKYFTSKEISDNIALTARAVSGAIRKLVTDGFVDKDTSASPLKYAITHLGMNIESE